LHFGHRQGVEVLVILVDDHDVAISIHIYGVAYDLAVETRRGVIPIDVNVRSGSKNRSFNIRAGPAVEDNFILIVHRNIDKQTFQLTTIGRIEGDIRPTGKVHVTMFHFQDNVRPLQVFGDHDAIVEAVNSCIQVVNAWWRERFLPGPRAHTSSIWTDLGDFTAAAYFGHKERRRISERNHADRYPGGEQLWFLDACRADDIDVMLIVDLDPATAF